MFNNTARLRVSLLFLLLFVMLSAGRLVTAQEQTEVGTPRRRP